MKSVLPDAQAFLDSQPLGEFLSDHGKLRHVMNSRGVSLCFYFWPATTPHCKGIIQVLHGHGSYIPYEFLKVEVAGKPPIYQGSWVQRMNAAGYSVCGLDNQGAGRSSGLRAYCNSFDEYVEDGLLLTRLCTEMGISGFEAPLPRFLLACSMGGCLAVMMALREQGISQGTQPMQPQSNGTVEGSAADPHELQPPSPGAAAGAEDAQQMQPPSPGVAKGAPLQRQVMVAASVGHPQPPLQRQKTLFSGVTLLAPMLSLEKISKRGSNRLLRPVGMLFDVLVPALAIVQTAKNVMYPELQVKFDSDPVCYHAPTRVRNANEYLRVTSWLMSNLDKIEFPFIVFHSENDTMCDCDGSKALYAEAASAVKELRLVNNMWHIIPKEPDNDKVLSEILQWFDQRCAQAATCP